jgi:NADH-quinone oxidoreductase subunit J
MMTLMAFAFYIAATVAVISTIMAITRLVAVHALLYLIVSLLAVAVVFYTMGAPLVAALEVIIYAGAIVVLFVFVVMMLNLGTQARETERQWLARDAWIGPVILSTLLLLEVIYLIVRVRTHSNMGGVADPKQVGIALYGPYLVGVELSSMLLLGALVGACHLGRPAPRRKEVRG